MLPLLILAASRYNLKQQNTIVIEASSGSSRKAAIRATMATSLFVAFLVYAAVRQRNRDCRLSSPVILPAFILLIVDARSLSARACELHVCTSDGFLPITYRACARSTLKVAAGLLRNCTEIGRRSQRTCIAIPRRRCTPKRTACRRRRHRLWRGDRQGGYGRGCTDGCEFRLVQLVLQRWCTPWL
jgi:hypothetical protein